MHFYLFIHLFLAVEYLQGEEDIAEMQQTKYDQLEEVIRPNFPQHIPILDSLKYLSLSMMVSNFFFFYFLFF